MPQMRIDALSYRNRAMNLQLVAPDLTTHRHLLARARGDAPLRGRARSQQSRRRGNRGAPAYRRSESMKAWFYGLQPRERWILAVGAAGFRGHHPVGLRREAAARRDGEICARPSTRSSGCSSIVARIEGEQPSSVATNRQGAEQTLAVIIESTARSHGLNPPRTRANGPSGVDVTIQSASFDALVAWLARSARHLWRRRRDGVVQHRARAGPRERSAVAAKALKP